MDKVRENIAELAEGFIKNRKATVRLVRNDYWPLIETDAGNGLLWEFFSTAQAFGFVGSPNVSVDSETWLDADAAESYVRKFQTRSDDDMNAIIEAWWKYFDAIAGLGLFDSRIERVIRIRSLFDLNVAEFGGISQFTDFIIGNLDFQVRQFGKENYVRFLEKTSELQVVFAGTHAPLSLPNERRRELCQVDFCGDRSSIVVQDVPGYSPLGVMYKAGVLSEVPNYFALASFQKVADREGIQRVAMTCLQYNFVNLLIDESEWMAVAEETERSERFRFMEKSEEESFRQGLKNALGENFMNAFVKMAISDLFEKHGVERIEIIAPEENLWLFEHNKSRTVESLRKSGYNLYTKIGVELWGEIDARWRAVISRKAVSRWKMHNWQSDQNG